MFWRQESRMLREGRGLRCSWSCSRGFPVPGRCGALGACGTAAAATGPGTAGRHAAGHRATAQLLCPALLGKCWFPRGHTWRPALPDLAQVPWDARFPRPQPVPLLTSGVFCAGTHVAFLATSASSTSGRSNHVGFAFLH